MALFLLRRAVFSLSNSLKFVGKSTVPFSSMAFSVCTRYCTSRNIMDFRNNFLLPSNYLLPVQQTSGLKTKGVLKKRCKDCYIVKRRGRFEPSVGKLPFERTRDIAEALSTEIDDCWIPVTTVVPQLAEFMNCPQISV